MKRKRKCLVWVLSLLAVGLFCIQQPKTVYAASANMDGQKEVSPGQKLAVSLLLQDAGKYAVMADLTYDTSIMTLETYSTPLEGWKMAIQNGVILVEEDNQFNSPLPADATVLSLVFVIRDTATVGSSISVTLNNVTTSSGTESSHLGAVSYSGKVVSVVCEDQNSSNTAQQNNPSNSQAPVNTQMQQEESTQSEISLQQKLNQLDGSVLNIILAILVTIVAVLGILLIPQMIREKREKKE